MDRQAVMAWLDAALHLSSVGGELDGQLRQRISAAGTPAQKGWMRLFDLVGANVSALEGAEAARDLGYALNGVARYLADMEPRLSQHLFALSYFLVQEHSALPGVQQLINFAFRNLRAQGIGRFETALPDLADRTTAVPRSIVAQLVSAQSPSAHPGAPGEVVRSATAATHSASTEASPAVGGGSDASASLQESTEPTDSTQHPTTPARGPGYRTGTERTSCVDVISLHCSHWGEEPLGGARLEAFRSYCLEHLGRRGAMARELGALVEARLGEIADLTASVRLPGDVMDLRAAARATRSAALSLGTTSMEDNEEVGRLWLLGGYFNHLLWTEPAGFRTNEPQVGISLIGYVSHMQMSRRYADEDRDLLLDCAETIVDLVYEIPAVLKYPFLAEAAKRAIGTYLLIGGPEPVAPQESFFDPRIQRKGASAGRRRAERDDWAGQLLEIWEDEPRQKMGAILALCMLARWNRLMVEWLISLSVGEAESSLRTTAWIDAAGSFLRSTDRVRVATNPWKPAGTSGAEGTLVTSGASGRFIVPDQVLRAAVARCLVGSDALAVNGSVFAGRRIPTYMLTNTFGPLALVKLDHQQKIQREMQNWKSYARRLHPNYRPSECHQGDITLHLGEDGAPLEMIATSYVFAENDSPATLRQWIRSATQDSAVSAVEFLFTRVLRPWTAFVRRHRFPLRMEYPVLRPRVGDRSHQWPKNWCKTELERITSSKVQDVPVSIDQQLIGSVLGQVEKAAGMSPAEMDSELTNPLWLAAELGEVGSGALVDAIESVGLRDFESLTCACHGDLHLENVLCLESGADLPRLVVIDFESVSESHVLKDFARLEASLLCEVHDWNPEEYAELSTWFAETPTQPSEACSGNGSAQVAKVCACVSRVRDLAFGCGQILWPLQPLEYELALLAALLPITRYEGNPSSSQALALRLSALTATRVHRALCPDDGPLDTQP